MGSMASWEIAQEDNVLYKKLLDKYERVEQERDEAVRLLEGIQKDYKVDDPMGLQTLVCIKSFLSRMKDAKK